MSTAAAFQIVVLLASGSFQAVLPSVSGQPSPSFPDTPAGARAFMDWMVPQYPKGRWNPPPTQVCVVGIEPFAADKPPYLVRPLHASQPPFRVLEPYGVRYHYIGDAERRQGMRRRSVAEALALCGVRSAPAGPK